MSFTDPGHIDNLNAEQERLLRQFWAVKLSDLSSDPLDKQLASTAGFDMSALSSALPSAPASKAASQASIASNSSSSSKKSWFGGWGSKKQEAAAAEESSSSSSSDEEFENATEGGGDAATADALAAEAAMSSKTTVDPLAGVKGASASKEALLEMAYFASGAHHPDMFPLRFIRARKWDLGKAFEMYSKALQWRVGINIRGILEAGEEGVGLNPIIKGKSYFLPKPDNQGRPITVIHAERHDRANDPLEETERFTIWSNEIAPLLQKGHVETGTLIFDLSNFGLKNMDWNFVKLLISILEGYYPESLGFAIIVNAPWIFNSIWKVIKGLLDPVVAGKFHFAKASEMSKFIPADVIPKPLGGPYEYKYIPASEQEKATTKALVADTAGRAKAEAQWKAAWDAFRVATREWIIAGAAFDKKNSKDTAEAYKAAAAKRLAAHEDVKTTFKVGYKWWYNPCLYTRLGMI